MPVNERLSEDELHILQFKFDEFIRAYDDYLFQHNEPDLNRNELYKEFEKKIKDPETIKKYRICQQIKENESKQTEIAKGLSAKYPLKDGQPNYLSRSLKYLLKTDGSPESKKYNEDLYRDYSKNPEAFMHQRMKNMLDFDATKLTSIQDDEVKMLEFIRDNPALAHEANEFGNPIDPTGVEGKVFGTSKRLADNLTSLRGMYQSINYAGSKLMAKYGSLESFMIPSGFNKDRARDIYMNSKKYLGKDYKLSVGLQNGLKIQAGFYDGSYSTGDIAKKLQALAKTIDKDMLIKYYPVKIDPQTGKETQASIEEFMKDSPNISIKERSEIEIDRLKMVRKQADLKYNFEFQKRMGIALDMGDKGYNVFKAIGKCKSGLFARDSKEYKEFAQSLADFTNPEKQGHIDKVDLRKKIDAYIEHTQQVKPEKNETDPVRRNRIQLALTAKRTLDEMDKDHVEEQVEAELTQGAAKAVDVQKEPAFKEPQEGLFGEMPEELEDVEHPIIENYMDLTNE